MEHSGIEDTRWITRRAPFGEAQLIDAEMSEDFSHETAPHDVITVSPPVR